MRLPRSSHPLSVSIRSLSGLAVLLVGFLPTVALANTGQLTCNPCTLYYGTIVVGQTETLPTTLTNTQTTSVTISSITTSNSAFKATNITLPLTLAAGKSVSFNVIFAPTATHWEGGKTTVASNASDKTLTVQVGGVGVGSESLTPSPATLAFGNVPVGTTATLPMALTNSGGSNIILAQTQLSGTGFAVSGLTLPVKLQPKQTVTFSLTFTPQTATTVGGSLVLPNGSVTIPLTGTGTSSTQGQLAFNPSSVNFGDVNVGSTGTQSMSATATGASVTITSSSSSSSLFALNGASFPLTIAKDQSVSFNLAFTPKTAGGASGTLTFISNASNSKALENLSGTGTTPQYSVNLTWSASSSPVVGYYVYRGTSLKGSYSRVNSTPDPATTYSDGTVASGTTYYYEATSVDSSGQESVPSTAVSAVVP
ncbi:MAG: choice-of-anchor D domain-containing protein [Acidobacteriia bacterium]|nr:choice-of-anchor D domain-containing protein [Terriglobia bacterium]